MKPIDCEEANQYLDQRMLGESLDPEKEEVLNEHIADCAICQQRWQKSMEMEEKISQTMHSVASQFSSPRTQVLLQLDVSVAEEEEKKVGFRWRGLMWGLLLATFMLIVLAYLGMVTAYKILEEKNVQQVRRDMTKIVGALEKERSRQGKLPSDLTFIPRESRLDPWGNSYHLSQENSRILLYSSGKNRKDEKGSGDDLWMALEVNKKLKIDSSSFKRSSGND